jgi:cell wall-associated NlpC family hydrolase
MNHASKPLTAFILAVTLLTACSTVTTPNQPVTIATPVEQGNEIVMFAMNLMDSGYKFGGSNPESGLDCSGMVSYIYQQVLGLKLPHNAAQIARAGKEIKPEELSPGDLVFFNTRGKPYSHVGIYIGDDRFIHAPGQDGKIKISSLKAGYFEKKFEAARTLVR